MVNNPSSGISYTNKQFSDIYPEMLDLVKKLSSKWDPSISNESDPGVILIKLNAILGDKLSYNIDKNIQELFPSTVSQISNARNLYRQLGYVMHWYQSAIVEVSIKWIGDADTTGAYITIPAFTQITNEDGDVSYSLIGLSNGTNQLNVGDMMLPLDGSTISCMAIEGTAEKYSILSDNVILPSNLDKDNRVYLIGTNWAENGIFITNRNTPNYSQWQRTDNILSEALNNRYFEFGVANNEYSCYIEFPEDYNNLMNDGVYITSIRTTGEAGKIKPKTLSKFVTNMSTRTSNGQNIVLSSDNIQIQNLSASFGGSNYESIQEAYKNYQYTVDTFDTLVTLRDYTNYLMRSKLVSNGYVTDKIKDPQSAYRITTKDNNLLGYVNQIEYGPKEYTGIEEGTGTERTILVREPVLNSMDRKIYGFEYVDSVETKFDYLHTFDIISTTTADTIKEYINDAKCIGHDWKPILDTTELQSHILAIKNKYSTELSVITKYALTSQQKDELKKIITKALYSSLNSKEIYFGQEILEQDLINIIMTSDNRIQSVSVKTLDYTPYAVVAKTSQTGVQSYVDVSLASDSNDIEYETEFDEDSTYNPLSTYSVGNICVYRGVRYKCIENTSVGSFNKNQWEEYSLQPVVDLDTFLSELKGVDYTSYVFGFDQTTYTLIKGDTTLVSETVYADFIDAVVALDIGIEGFLNASDFEGISKMYVHISKSRQIKDEIYTKSILEGSTNFVVNDEEINYNFNRSVENSYSDIVGVSSNVDITFSSSGSQYTLRNNEYAQFVSPNLIPINNRKANYSGSVKFTYYITQDISANSNYKLGASEFIIFWYKKEGLTSEYYSYDIYAQGCVIKPTFVITASGGSASDVIGAELNNSDIVHNISGDDSNPIKIGSSDDSGSISTSLNSSVAGIINGNNILSGTKTIEVNQINRVSLPKYCLCYWITNEIRNNQYILFSSTDGSSRILNSGETFMYYTDSSMTELVTLGAGTEIIRSDSDRLTWSVAMVSAEDYLLYGVQAITPYLYTTSYPASVNIQQIVTLTPGCMIKLTSDTQTFPVTLNHSFASLAGYTISYKEATSLDEEQEIVLDNVLFSSGWQGRSLLSVNTGKDTCQKILDNQSISLYDSIESDVPVITFNGSAAIEDDTQYTMPDETFVDGRDYYIALMSTRDIESDGSDIFVFDSSDFYLIHEYQNKPGKISFSDTSVSLLFDQNTTTQRFVLKLPENHDYIFNYVINNTSLTPASDHTIMYNGTNPVTLFVNQFNDSVVTYIPGSNKFVHMSSEQTAYGPVVTVTVPSHSGNVMVTLSNLEKYNYGLLSEYEFMKYGRLIGRFDIQDNYNYQYTVSDDDEISNPLSGASMFMLNHWINPYVISQLDVDNSILQVK